jgi:hypothetical protein
MRDGNGPSINGSVIPSACRGRQMRSSVSPNAQRRAGRGFASLMQPSKPVPGVPFAVSAAMRESERAPSHLTRLDLRRWCH